MKIDRAAVIAKIDRMAKCGGLSSDTYTALEELGEFVFKLPSPAEPEAIVRPIIVCLCGSGRFRDAFEGAEFAETLLGKIVLTIGCNTKDIERTPDLERFKPMLDELHLRKIDLADEVLILNVGGYIGESTRRELEYAKKQGKHIRYLEKIVEVANG